MWNIVKGALLVAVLWNTWAFGVGTKFWTSATFEDFGRGNFSGISLSREGALQLAPALDEIFNSDQAMIWAVGRDPGGNVYVGTSPDGKIYKVDPSGRSQDFFNPQSKYIWALVFGADGNLYAGTG